MVRRLVVNFLINGQPSYQDTSFLGPSEPADGLEIYFNAFEYRSDRNTLRSFHRCIDLAKIAWLNEHSGQWIVDPVAFRQSGPDFQLPSWLDRKVAVEPEVVQFEDDFAGKKTRSSRVFFRVERSDLEKSRDTIFLSHKSADKAIVRELANALDLCGYNSWLDERSMDAGAAMERSLFEAFENARAVVF